MGLEGIEIVMELEREFGIDIPDSDCQAIETVEDLAATVWTRLTEAHQSAAPCPRARCFLEWRRRILEDTNLASSDIRPSTTIESLNAAFPDGTLIPKWEKWRSRFPWLPVPVRLWDDMKFHRVSAFQILMLILAIATPIALHPYLESGLLIMIDGLLLFFMFYSITWYRGPLTIAPHFETLGDVVRHAVPPHLFLADGTANREWFRSVNYVMLRVRTVIAENLGIPLAEVLPESDIEEVLDS